MGWLVSRALWRALGVGLGSLLVACASPAPGESRPLHRPEDGPAPAALPRPLPSQRQLEAGCTPPALPVPAAFDLSDWLATHAALRPQARTPQSGAADPLPFVGQDWPAELATYHAAWAQVIGPLPQGCASLAPRDEALSLTPAELALLQVPLEAGRPPPVPAPTLRRVSYQGHHGGRIAALLWSPAAPGPHPAVVVLHQALPVCGKKEAAGVCLSGLPWLAFARALAERGVVALAPDSVGYGDRAAQMEATGSEYADAAPLLARAPGSTLLGLMVADVARGLDYLQTLPEVDPARLGLMGHSLGGILALFTAALDPRARCSLSNAGPNLLRRETQGALGLPPGIARWAGYGYLPALGFYHDRAELPVEVPQLYALVAPRGLFVAMMEDDTIAPRYDRSDFAIAQAQRAFDALGGDFAAHVVRSGLTAACQDEWAAPMCGELTYLRCQRQGDDECLARLAALGVTAACVAEHSGSPVQCVHQLYWDQCRKQGQDDGACLQRFAAGGVPLSAACLDEGFRRGCGRDHGWYPEVAARAYPWLLACLQR